MKKLLLILLCVPLIGLGQEIYSENNSVNNSLFVSQFRDFIQSPTLEEKIHKEFWGNIDKFNLTIEEVLGLKQKELNSVMTANSEGMLYFYQDALISLEKGSPYMSKNRQRWYEEDAIKLLQKDKMKEVYNIKKGHKELMYKISNKIPVYNANTKESIVFTKEMILEIIQGLELEVQRVYERVNILYQRNYFK
jgi:hypothetical protein